MKFPERLLMMVLCFSGITAASRLSNKYLQSNFRAGSTHFAPYQAVAGAGSRLSPNVAHNYGPANAGISHIVTKFGHSKTTARTPILRSEFNNDGSGNYHFGFETGNGIKRDESGLFQGSWPGGSLKIAGSYSYTGDDGKLYSINYKADKNGFQAEGDHLPTPPPIPREIQETLHLHQHGSSNQPSSTSSLAVSAGYSNARHQNLASPRHPSNANVLIPNINYLPTQQNQGYNYGRFH